MPDVIDSLWPEVIRAKVQSPESILLAQADALTRQTNNVLVGKVVFGPSDDNLVVLYFNIVVPTLKDYRHRIMVVQHRKDMHYPALIDAEVFRASGLAVLQAAMKALRSSPFLLAAEGAEPTKPDNRADSDKEFIDLVRKVLQSPYVVSVAQSLIARATDANSGRRIEPFNPQAESEADRGKEPPDTSRAPRD